MFALTACNSAKKPSATNFTKGIDAYLSRHGEACTVIGRQFPIDIPRSEQDEQYGIGPELAALEQAGLVHGTDRNAVVHGMLDPLRGATPPRPAKRYELTTNGKKYFQQITGPFGQTNGFCYGQKSVDAIVKWTEPVTVGPYSQTKVTYTYKIVALAPWAKGPQVQRMFSDIKTTVTGASNTTEVVELQLTSKGWEVCGQ
jgi:hypothetical protein